MLFGGYLLTSLRISWRILRSVSMPRALAISIEFKYALFPYQWKTRSMKRVVEVKFQHVERVPIIELFHRLARREVAEVFIEVGLPEFNHWPPPNTEFVFVVCVEGGCVKDHGLAGLEVGGGVALP